MFGGVYPGEVAPGQAKVLAPSGAPGVVPEVSLPRRVPAQRRRTVVSPPVPQQGAAVPTVEPTARPRVFPFLRRTQAPAPVRAQVNPPYPAAQAVRVRRWGMLSRRGDLQQDFTPAAQDGPLSPGRRRALAVPPRRGAAPASPKTTQTVPPPSTVTEAGPRWRRRVTVPARRGAAPTVTAPQSAPLAEPAARPRWRPLARRAQTPAPVRAQQVTPPLYPVAPVRLRRSWAPLRRPAAVPVAPAQGALPAEPTARSRVFPFLRRAQTPTPVRAQVNPPYPPVQAGRIRRLGAHWRRPTAPVPVRGQVNPPYPVGPAKVRRAATPARRPATPVAVPAQLGGGGQPPPRARWVSPRRTRPQSAPLPVQQAPVPPAWPTSPAPRPRRLGFPARRATAPTPTTGQAPTAGQGRVRRPAWWLRRPSAPVPVRAQLNPPYPLQPVKARRPAAPARRAETLTAPAGQQGVAAPAQTRARWAPVRRARTAPGPTPQQQTVVPPAWPTSPAPKPRRFGSLARRAQAPVPVRAQVNPPYPAAQAVRVRRSAAGLRRPSAQAPAPAQTPVAAAAASRARWVAPRRPRAVPSPTLTQTAPTPPAWPASPASKPRRFGFTARRPSAPVPVRGQLNPPYPVAPVKVRRGGAVPRRPAAVAPVSGANLAPLPPARRRALLLPRRARTPGPAPQQQTVVAPPWPPTVVETRRRAALAARRTPARVPAPQAAPVPQPRLRRSWLPGRRPETVTPVPAQVVVAPQWPTAPVKARRPQATTPARRRVTGPTPAQVPAPPVWPPVKAGRRELWPVLRVKPRLPAPTPAQDAAPAGQRRRPATAVTVRRRNLVPVQPQTTPPAKAAARRPVLAPRRPTRPVSPVKTQFTAPPPYPPSRAPLHRFGALLRRALGFTRAQPAPVDYVIWVAGELDWWDVQDAGPILKVTARDAGPTWAPAEPPGAWTPRAGDGWAAQEQPPTVG